MTKFVVAYDISSPKRLQKAYRYLSSVALPIQYSVFLFSGSEKHCEECIRDLKKIINEKYDDLRVYALPESGLKLCLGKSLLPDGLYYSEGL